MAIRDDIVSILRIVLVHGIVMIIELLPLLCSQKDCPLGCLKSANKMQRI